MGFWVQGRVDLGCRVQGSEFRAKDVGFRVWEDAGRVLQGYP